jgi:hypothetical protein
MLVYNNQCYLDIVEKILSVTFFGNENQLEWLGSERQDTTKDDFSGRPPEDLLCFPRVGPHEHDLNHLQLSVSSWGNTSGYDLSETGL